MAEDLFVAMAKKKTKDRFCERLFRVLHIVDRFCERLFRVLHRVILWIALLLLGLIHLAKLIEELQRGF